jgi:hypothetical protein
MVTFSLCDFANPESAVEDSHLAMTEDADTFPTWQCDFHIGQRLFPPGNNEMNF